MSSGSATHPSTCQSAACRILAVVAAVCTTTLLCTGLVVDYTQSWNVTVQSNAGKRLGKAQLSIVHGIDKKERRTLDTETADSNGTAKIELHEEYLDVIDTTEYFVIATSSDTAPDGRRFMPAETPVLFGVSSLVVVMYPDTAAAH